MKKLVISLLMLILITSFASAVNNNGLVTYLSFNEGKGLQVDDYSGNSLGGVVSGTTSWATGARGKSVLFNGGTFDGANSSLYTFYTNPFTLCYWVKSTDVSGTVIAQGSFSGSGWAETFNSNILIWQDPSGLANTFQLSPNPVNDGNWHNTCVRKNSTGLARYVDGTVRATLANTANLSKQAPLRIGSGPEGGFVGNIDELMIYNRGLSDAEIFNIYKTGQQKLNTPNTNNGLVGYWSFNEGKGTQSQDYSGGNINGLNINNPIYTAGKFGKALSFNGTNQYVNLGNNPSLTSISGTWAFWVVNKGTAKTYYFIDRSENADEYGTAAIGMIAGQGLFIASNTNTTNTPCVTSVISYANLNNGDHLVLTFSNLTATLYRNGALFNSWTCSNTFNNAPYQNTTIGRAGEFNAYYFDGVLDEVKIYNRAISASEVYQLYKSGSEKLNAPSSNNGLVGYWSGNEGKGLVAQDYSGNNNQGTMINGATFSNGKLGKGFSFDGINDRITIPSITTTNNFTYSTWIKPNGVQVGSTDYQPLFVNADDSRGIYYRGVNAGADANKITYWVGSNKNSDAVINRGNWNHVVITNNDGVINFTINGLNAGSGTGGITFDAVFIGNTPFPLSFNGTIDETRFYNRALSASEVQQLYKAGSQLTR